MTIHRCLAAVLLAALAASLSSPASAQELQWGQPLKWEEVDKPGRNGEIVISPSEINRIAASRDIVYALDTANGRLHRSDNGGLTFTDITRPLSSLGAGSQWEEIAVAPDMPWYVAVVTDNRKRVFLSDDSGATWHGYGENDGIVLAANETIQCIAISSGYSSPSNSTVHDIAIGTALWGDSMGSGQVLTFQIGSGFTTSWTNTNNITTVGSARADVSAVAFSPRYKDDSIILAIASDASATYLCIGVRDLSRNTTVWNSATGIVSDPPYPVQIDSAPGDGGFGFTGILSNIALPSDYGGNNGSATDRIAFVSYYRTDINTANNVYRLNDTNVFNLFASAEDVSSIAYYGNLLSGKLLAGEVGMSGPNTAQVRWTLTPLGNPPGTGNVIGWNPANQPPTGPGNAQVAWSQSGKVAFCGTGQVPGIPLDESSFSQSQDNGNNWSQTSLMNTNIHMTDIAPAPDSRSLFMATYSDFGPESVWRSAGEPLGKYWGRLLNMPSRTDRVILRLSPDYATDYTLYAVEVDSTASENLTIADNITSNLLQISESRGNYWKKRFIPRPVVDMIAASQYTLYLATLGGYIRKSTDAGLTWGDGVMTGLYDISMLAVSNNGHVFAGSKDGFVAYSTDEGASFTKIETQAGIFLQDIQVQPDADYSSNNVIYASGRTYDTVDQMTHNVIDAGVWRWTIGQSSQWEQIDTAITDLETGEQISGLRVGPEGTLYALRADMHDVKVQTGHSDITINTSEGMNRTLDPLFSIAEEVEWDVINRTLTRDSIAFDPSPLELAGNLPWLKLSGDANENDLWAIDTSIVQVDNTTILSDNTTAIYRFRDNICKTGPVTTGPTEVGCDPVTGRNQQVDLFWEQLSLSDRYDLQLAKDIDFTLRIDPAVSNSENVSAVTGSIHIVTDPISVTSPAVWLSPASLPEAGADYYWRIRTYHAATGEFIRSPWSITDNFFVKPGFPVTTPYYGPQVFSPADGCDCKFGAPVSFSWSPYKEVTKYRFELSERPDLSGPLVSITLNDPAYRYSGQLKNDSAYFWRVTAMEPSPGEPGAVFTFHTATTAAPIHVTVKTQTVPLWVIIGSAAGMLAIIILLALIFRRWGVLPQGGEKY